MPQGPEVGEEAEDDYVDTLIGLLEELLLQNVLEQTNKEGFPAEAALPPVSGEHGAVARGKRVEVEEDGEHGLRGGNHGARVSHLDLIFK